MKKYIFLTLIGILSGCKSKKIAVATSDFVPMNQSEIIKKQSENEPDFKTLYIKSSARYEDPNQSQNVSADIRIEKDKKILISIRVLGITMAKAFITPEKVQYYEKIEHTHFEGDFEGLSRWLGTDLDFDKIQNLLIGQPLYELKDLNLTYQKSEEQNLLIESSSELVKKFYFHSENALLARQFFLSDAKQTTLQIDQKEHQNIQEFLIPTFIQITAIQRENQVKISMNYNSVTFNESFSFPYDVPNGSTQIFID